MTKAEAQSAARAQNYTDNQINETIQEEMDAFNDHIVGYAIHSFDSACPSPRMSGRNLCTRSHQRTIQLL